MKRILRALLLGSIVGVSSHAYSAATVTAWVRVSEESQGFTLASPQKIRYGDGGIRWAPAKTLTGANVCSNALFGADPAPGALKFCEVQKTVPAVEQIPGEMPVVNRALIPAPAPGYDTARRRPLSAEERAAGSIWAAVRSDVGAFRVPCGSYAHISNDDPIVFPGQPGKSHLHTFMGNALANAASTPDSLLSSGGSTCAGGTLNRTAYWMPSMIDTRTGQPLIPVSTNFYYKLGYLGVKAGTVQPFPKGLRMIAGDASNTRPRGSLNRFGCLGKVDSGWHAEIPPCAAGDDLVVSVVFPQCWDGTNLDSPDHHSHMAYGIPGKGCPADHPVPLPEVTQNVHYIPTEPSGTANWRLSSDNYSGPGGYSLHSDWYGAWDPATMKRFIDHCINQSMDCHDNLLNDGSVLF